MGDLATYLRRARIRRLQRWLAKAERERDHAERRAALLRAMIKEITHG